MTSLRGRTRDSSWQWLIIGVVLGLGCSSVACLGSYAAGLLKFNVPGVAVAQDSTPTLGPTLTPVVITVIASPAPTSTNPSVATSAATTAALVQGSDNPTPTSFVVAATTASPATAAVNSAVSAGTEQVVGTSLVPPSKPPPTRVPGTQSASGVGITLEPQGTNIPQALAPTDLVTINGGIFKMGTTSKEAQQAVDDCTTRDKGKCVLESAADSIGEHDVTLDSFQIEKFEVSYEQYLAFLNSLSDSYKSACGGQPCVALQDNAQYKVSVIKQEGAEYKLTSELYRDRPVQFVTWYGADAYCRSIGRRLPTEAEWERAARFTDKRIYPWGNDWDPTGARANTNKPTSQGGPLPIDKYANGVSQEGVYNLAGNVAEWVSDWYDANYYKSADTQRFVKPKGPAKGDQKVVRGGSWDNPPFFARAVHRQSFSPTVASATIGFRCAADGAANKTGGSGSGANPTTSGGSSGTAATPTKKGTLVPNPAG